MSGARWLLLTLTGFCLLAIVVALWARTRLPLEAEDFGETVDSAGLAKIIGDADQLAMKDSKGATSNGGAAPRTSALRKARRDRGGDPLPTGEAEFRRAAEAALARLPKKAVLEKPGRDYHWAPPELMEDLEAFGRLADAIRANPALTPQGLDFYRACALSRDTLLAVRAACLRSLKDLATRTNVGGVDEREFPELVRRVADKLPSDVR